MEKYYIVTEKSRLNKEWYEYKTNSREVKELVKRFTKTHGIESDGYYVDDKYLYIVPTEKDFDTFRSVLCSPVGKELCKFKASSKIGRAWTKELAESGLQVKHKPMVIMYFKRFGGRFKSRLFEDRDVLYCSIEPYEGQPPEGMIEIKASEFYKVIEESE